MDALGPRSGITFTRDLVLEFWNMRVGILLGYIAMRSRVLTKSEWL